MKEDKTVQNVAAEGPAYGPENEEEFRAREREEEELRVQQEERRRIRREERDRAQVEAWNSFMRAEREELELRKEGQLADLLGPPLPEETPETLQRLVRADQKQAQEGLVALMSGGKLFYKRVDELSEDDMQARIAARRLRTTWLKERHEVWGGTKINPGRNS